MSQARELTITHTAADTKRGMTMTEVDAFVREVNARMDLAGTTVRARLTMSGKLKSMTATSTVQGAGEPWAVPEVVMGTRALGAAPGVS